MRQQCVIGLFKVNMETTQFKQKCLCGGHTFNALKMFSSFKLPTYKEVIERVLYEKKLD